MSELPAFTFEEFWEKFQPCGWDEPDDGKNYTLTRLRRLWGYRTTLTAADIPDLDIPAQDKMWAATQNGVLPKQMLTALVKRVVARAVEENGVDDDPLLSQWAARWLRIPDRSEGVWTNVQAHWTEQDALEVLANLSEVEYERQVDDLRAVLKERGHA